VQYNDGGWSMRIVPRGKKPNQEIRTDGAWGYQATGVACAYFPAVRKVYDRPALCKPPARAKVTIRNQHLATVITSPAGRWTPLPSIGYVLWYTGIRSGNETVLADCVLETAERTLCTPILMDARSRQQRALEALVRRK
jgi:hypothetical protein